MENQNQILKSLKSRLSGKSLEHLIIASTVFSAYDYFSKWPNEYAFINPLLNHSNSIIFTKVLLEIDSNYFKKGIFHPRDLPLVINSCNDLAARLDFFEDESLLPEDKIQVLIAHLMSSQLWEGKRNPPDVTGILYRLYNEIPKKFEQELKAKHGRNFINIPEVISKDIGIEIDNYFVISIYLNFMLFEEVYRKTLFPNSEEQELVKSLEGERNAQNIARGDIINERLRRIPFLYTQFTFTKESIADRFPFVSIREINNYFHLTSRTFFELKKINQKEAHQRGHLSQRVSPFERYPILKLDFPAYVIPNFRLFGIAYNSLLRWKLQDLFKNNSFNEILGSCQEYILGELFDQIKGDFKIIPEREYLVKGTQYKGPDFTLIDNKRLILIESKAKHVLLNTRLEHYSKHLLMDLDNMIDALIKLQDEKLEHIKSDNETYPEIDFKLDGNVVLVGVIGSGVGSLQEFIVQLKKKYPKHKINQLRLPFVLMDIYSLHECIEVSKYNDISVYDLIIEYWETGNNFSPKESAADSFGSREYSVENSYAAKSFERIIESIRKKFEEVGI